MFVKCVLKNFCPILLLQKYLTREERWSTLSKKLTEAELKWLPNDDGASDLPVFLHKK